MAQLGEQLQKADAADALLAALAAGTRRPVFPTSDEERVVLVIDVPRQVAADLLSRPPH